jgi:hypothetical protein
MSSSFGSDRYSEGMNPIVERNAATVVGAIKKLNETVGGWATFTPTERHRPRAVYNFSYEVATGRIVLFRSGQVKGATGPNARRSDPEPAAGPGVATDGRVTVAFDLARLPDLRPGQRLGLLIEVVGIEALRGLPREGEAFAVFALTRLRVNELLSHLALD